MTAIREYILSVIAAALVSGVLSALLDKKGMPGTMGKIFCGIFLSITLISPLTDLSFASLTDWIEAGTAEGEYLAAEGENISASRIQANIKTECEAYIQDKARELGLDVAAQVNLERSPPYAPESVTILGTAAPYSKTSLCDIIEENLAIPRENIQWN